MGLYGVRVRPRRDLAVFPNYFGQTCSSRDLMSKLAEWPPDNGVTYVGIWAKF